ncbi:ABC transporter substrate-binding protein [Cohnella soli]|uniref:ABC transporter substrate-binding protein n=1 Tax=Cohnella soli TaxID=425005 RepID=A0ABW0HWT5_9BACL
MKRKVSVFAAICLIFTLLVTACGSSKNEQNQAATGSSPEPSSAQPSTAAATSEATPATPTIKGKITFVNSRVDFEDKFKEIAAAFKAKYPEAEVDVELVKEIDQVLKIRLASDEAPDVFQYTTNIIPAGSDKLAEYLLPLDDMGYTKDTIAFYDLPYHMYEGKHYGLTEGVYVTGILASKKVLESVGVTTYPKTLDELYALADKLKAKGIVPFGSMLKSGWPLGSWNAVAFANLTGTVDDFYKQMNESDTPFALDTPLGKAFSFVRALKDKGYFDEDLMSSDWDVLRLHMDKVGMLMLANYGIGALEGLDPKDVAFFPLPIDNSGTPIAQRNSSWDIGISKNTKNPETAKAFVKFLLEESGYADLVGEAPSVASVGSKNPALNEFLQQNIKYVDSTSSDSKIYGRYQEIMNKAQINEGMIYQDVLMNKDSDIKPVLDKYNKKFADSRKASGK